MITTMQCLVLGAAGQIGAVIGVPELPKVAMLESSAGIRLVATNGEYFGVAHMGIDTAIEVIKRHPKMWDGEITRGGILERLIFDTKWALKMAALRIVDLRKDGFPIGAYTSGKTGWLKGKGREYKKLLTSTENTIASCSQDNKKRGDI